MTNDPHPLDVRHPQAPADFDFLRGRWQVRHRRLKDRLTGCTEWETFQGQSCGQAMMGGLGNADDNLIELPSGSYRAVSLRCYDAARQQWSIWWLDERMPGQIDVPVVGRFVDGVGTFLANDTLRGQPIVVRFRWTGTDTPTPRWEQAFSPDGGTTWETNWEMDFSRPQAAPGAA